MSSADYVWELSRALLDGQRGVTAVLKVYMDESGTHGTGSPAVTVGAALARPSVWKVWTKDWNVQKRPVKVHHSVDCHNRVGEYDGWSRPYRDEYVKRILPVIDKHKINGRIGGIHIQSYERAISQRPDVQAAFGEPYVACFQWAITDICNTALDQGHRRIAFFHECNDYQDDALAAFGRVRARFPGMRLTIAFGGKADYVPLQCADVLAFEGNRRLRDTTAPTRKPMEVIDPDGDRIGFIEYDEDSTREFAANMCRLYDELRASGVAIGARP